MRQKKIADPSDPSGNTMISVANTPDSAQRFNVTFQIPYALDAKCEPATCAENEYPSMQDASIVDDCKRVGSEIKGDSDFERYKDSTASMTDNRLTAGYPLLWNYDWL